MMVSLLLTLMGLLTVAPCSLGNDVQEEIYNGYTAARGQLPFQALQIHQHRDNTYTSCGGSLVSPNTVLTAAHCVQNLVQTTVYLGMTNSEDGTGVVYYVVSAGFTKFHESYNPNNFQNDIAFLRLPGSVRLSSQIQVIALPKRAWSPPTTFDNYSVTASGWGQTYDGEDGPHQFLQYRTIHKMPQTDCVNYYRNVLAVTNGMICTDKNVVYSGPCKGDSGGPLTVQLTSGLYVIGAVSWGVGSCSSTNPVVFTNVAYYLDWITRNTGISTS